MSYMWKVSVSKSYLWKTKWKLNRVCYLIDFTVICHEKVCWCFNWFLRQVSVSRRKHYPHTAAHSVMTVVPARNLRATLESRDEESGSGNIADGSDNPLNACVNSHHPSHFTVTGHLYCVCQPFPSAKHEVVSDRACSWGELHVGNGGWVKHWPSELWVWFSWKTSVCAGETYKYIIQNCMKASQCQ